jgi:hypothetical protein
VTSTIASRKVAAVRLRLDAPATAYFFNPKTGLRIDLLFDFPVPAATLAEHATRTTIRSHVFDIASEPDLLRLKRIANAARSAPGDAEDIAFLELRRKHSRSMGSGAQSASCRVCRRSDSAPSAAISADQRDTDHGNRPGNRPLLDTRVSRLRPTEAGVSEGS